MPIAINEGFHESPQTMAKFYVVLLFMSFEGDAQV
jgi:hypothetical protein